MVIITMEQKNAFLRAQDGKLHIVVQSHDTSGNVMGRAHTNPTLDTRMYHIEFDGVEITKLTANVIVQSIYTQCDADGREHLLLDLLVDYHKNNKAMSLTEQLITIQGRPVTCKTTAG